MSLFVDYTLNGVAQGMVFAALALALVLIYQATHIINFAQGAMGMMTTFIAFSLLNDGISLLVGVRRRPGGRLRPRSGRRTHLDPTLGTSFRAQPGDRDDRAADRARGDRRGGLQQLVARISGRLLPKRSRHRTHPHRLFPLRRVHRRRRARALGRDARPVPLDRRSDCACAPRRLPARLLAFWACGSV